MSDSPTVTHDALVVSGQVGSFQPVESALLTPTPKAERRFWGFFTTKISDDNTRRAYIDAVKRFAEWCGDVLGIRELDQVQPMHVAAYLKALEKQGISAPTVKQHLAAVRMFFDWLVVGHITDVNPTRAVRGPRHSPQKGKTPVLSAEEARLLLDSIETDTVIGLRDRALIGLMVYTFACVGVLR